MSALLVEPPEPPEPGEPHGPARSGGSAGFGVPGGVCGHGLRWFPGVFCDLQAGHAGAHQRLTLDQAVIPIPYVTPGDGSLSWDAAVPGDLLPSVGDLTVVVERHSRYQFVNGRQYCAACRELVCVPGVGDEVGQLEESTHIASAVRNYLTGDNRA